MEKNMEKNMETAIINEEQSVREAIKQLNENRLQILVVVDEEGALAGTVTDGDIRRAVLKDLSLDNPVREIMNKNPRFVQVGSESKAYNLMLKKRIKAIPVVDEGKKVTGLLLLEDFLGPKKEKEIKKKNNFVVIMAGGKGSRLDPFTKILPKPLIPIGDKPIIEIIMRNFQRCGFNNFLLSLNYKAEMIKMYFAENAEGFNICYTEEKEFLGTAGSLCLAGEKLNETFIVSNCDVIMEMDFEDLLNHHRSSGNHCTVVGVVKNMQIPYGVLETENGRLSRLREKPEYDLVINSGIYALEPEIVGLIPKNQPLDMPDLLLSAGATGYKVGVYPVSSNWFDVGQWEEYQRTLEYFKKADEL